MPEYFDGSSLSVIIPTYNRRELLCQAIEGYFRQSSPAGIREIMVVDDGSTDGTEAALLELAKRSPVPIRYFWQVNKGPAAARNIGIREARSPVLLFSDSDIIPKDDLVSQHLAWHKERPQTTEAVLGYVTWASCVPVTPFMRWYGNNKLFEFSKLRRGEVHPGLFYTCNVSLKRTFLTTCGLFDEEFRTAAYEDTELGYRLSQRGLQLLYNPAAIGYHNQSFTFAQACSKAKANLDALQTFLKKEAGKEVLHQLTENRHSVSYRCKISVARMLATVFSPLRHFLDSPFPLPDQVYQLFFWESTQITESIHRRRSSDIQSEVEFGRRQTL